MGRLGRWNNFLQAPILMKCDFVEKPKRRYAIQAEPALFLGRPVSESPQGPVVRTKMASNRQTFHVGVWYQQNLIHILYHRLKRFRSPRDLPNTPPPCPTQVTIHSFSYVSQRGPTTQPTCAMPYPFYAASSADCLGQRVFRHGFDVLCDHMLNGVGAEALSSPVREQFCKPPSRHG